MNCHRCGKPVMFKEGSRMMVISHELTKEQAEAINSKDNSRVGEMNFKVQFVVHKNCEDEADKREK